MADSIYCPDSVNCPRCETPMADSAIACATCGLLRGAAFKTRDGLIGTEIAGRFKIEALIGQGGMGKVYKARHLALERSVCLKVLKPALLEDPTLVGRFEREALAASRLNHPNAIQVIDFGRTSEDGTLYIAMEYVQGKDLRLILRDDGPLPEERLCRLVGQVLAALGEAHARNVIHRDLKPENIMVAVLPDQGEIVKVLDFGIAKILDSDLPGLTRSDVVCGTPQYMAPEQATGAMLDARCDLYAVGVILYQLATGSLPFDGQNSMEVLTRQVNDPPEPPRKRAPNAKISLPMERLILRALEKEASARPQTAAEFRRLLLEVPELSRRSDAEELEGKLFSSGSMAAVTAGGTPLDPSLSRSSPSESMKAPEWAHSHSSRGKRTILAAGVLIALGVGSFAWQRQRAHAFDTAPVPVPTATDPQNVEGLEEARRAKAKAAALVEQAQQLQRDGDTASARDLLEKAVALDPDNARAHYRLGGLYLYTQPERARVEYDRAVELDPAIYGAQVKAIESKMGAKK